MNWAGILFLLNAVFNFVLHYLGYGLKWEGKEAEVDTSNTTKLDIFHHEYIDKEGEKKDLDTEKLKEVF